MSTHSIHFYDKIGKVLKLSINIELSEEFPKD